MKGEKYLFKVFTSKTITSQILHSILIISQYFMTVFPFAISAKFKISAINSEYTPSRLEDSIRVLKRLSESLRQGAGDSFRGAFLNSLSLSVIIITAVFLVVYYLLLFFYKESAAIKKIDWVIANFYGLIFFRYISFFFIYFMTYPITSLYIGHNNYDDTVVIIFISILLFIYIGTYFFFIGNNSLSQYINNQSLVRNTSRYPFDLYSELYEKHFLFLFLICSFESNLEVKKKISMLNGTLNVLVIICSFYLAIKENLLFFSKKNKIYFLANSNLNFIKKIIITFNCCLILSSIFICKKRDFNTEIYNICLCFNLSVAFVFIRWFVYDKPSLLDNKKIPTELFLFLFTKDLESKGDSIENEIFKNLKASFYLKENKEIISEHKKSILKGQTKISETEILLLLSKFISKEVKTNVYESYLLKFIKEKIKGNIFKSYKYFNIITTDRNCDLSIKNVVHYIGYDSPKENLSVNQKFILRLIKLNQLHERIEKNLLMFKKIFENDLVTQTTESFLLCSKDLCHIKKDMTSLLSENEVSSGFVGRSMNQKKVDQIRDQIMRSASSIFKYTFVLSRYILESLLNESIQKSNKLNIETFEEYLVYNFFQSSFIVLSTTLNSTGVSSFNVVSFCGPLKKNAKVLCEYFPSKYKKEGNSKFHKTLAKTREDSLGIFEYVFGVKEYVEHFVYHFEVFNSILSDRIIISGYYKIIYSKIMVVKVDNEGDLRIVNYSRAMAKILVINPMILEKLRTDFDYHCKLSLFFSDIVVHKDYSSLECKLSYEYLFDGFKSISSILTAKDIKSEDPELLTMLSKLKLAFSSKLKLNRLLKFEKLFNINSKTIVYNLHVSSKEKTKEETAVKNVGTGKSSDDTSKAASSNNDLYFNNMTAMHSSTSGTDQSFGKNSTKSSLIEKAFVEGKIIKKEAKALSMASMLTLLLSVIIIILCFVFLCIQIIQTNNLISLNSLFFDFKYLRMAFNNVFYSVISVSCTSEDRYFSYYEKCDNKLVKMFKAYQEKVNFTDYDIADYTWYEVGTKVDLLRNSYTSLKKKLLGKNSNFVTLLENKLNFSQIEQRDNEVVQHKNEYEFDKATQITINYETELTSVPSEESYMWKVFPLFNVASGKFDFSTSYSKNLLNIHKLILGIISNFPNFAISYNNGETMISNYFFKSKKTNIVTTVSFMGSFIVLNLLLFIISTNNIKIGNLLFKKLMINISMKISEAEFNKFFLIKLELLLQLSGLYRKNPSTLIQNVSKNKSAFLRVEGQKEKHTLNKTTETPIDERKDEKSMVCLSMLNNNSYQMNEFFVKAIRPLQNKNCFFFSIYFIIVFIFDVVLVTQITSVYSIRDYVDSSYNFQLMMYSSISLVHLMHLVNSTEANLANALGIKEKEDGTVNIYIKRALNYYREVLSMQKEKSYPKEEDYFGTDCSSIYKATNDSLFIDYQRDVLGKYDTSNYFTFQEIFCRNFSIDKHPYFGYEDYITRLKIIHNQYMDKTLEGINGIFNEEFYNIYLYIYFFIRPVRKSFDIYILTDIIIDKFNSYMVYVWVYLIVNIILETFIFCFTKVFVTNKLDKIKALLFLFAQCIQ